MLYGFRIQGMSRYGTDRANHYTMTTGKKAVICDDGLASLEGYRFRWTHTDAQTATGAFVRINGCCNYPASDHSRKTNRFSLYS
jgi:hypothetical protein